MSYVRWNPGNLYMWWDDSHSRKDRGSQVLALWYAPDVAKEDKVLYFSYRILVNNMWYCLEQCKEVGLTRWRERRKFKKCAKEFIKDVEKDILKGD